MKTKTILSLTVISMFSAGLIFAENAREQQLMESLTVESKNIVNGNVTAEDGAQVNVGGVEIGGAAINTFEAHIDNNVQEIEARGASVVSVGGFSGKNMTAESVYFESTNRVDGKITAIDGEVFIGAANLDNLNAGRVDIRTNNEVHGTIKATNGGKVNIGSVTN